MHRLLALLGLHRLIGAERQVCNTRRSSVEMFSYNMQLDRENDFPWQAWWSSHQLPCPALSRPRRRPGPATDAGWADTHDRRSGRAAVPDVMCSRRRKPVLIWPSCDAAGYSGHLCIDDAAAGGRRRPPRGRRPPPGARAGGGGGARARGGPRGGRPAAFATGHRPDRRVAESRRRGRLSR